MSQFIDIESKHDTNEDEDPVGTQSGISSSSSTPRQKRRFGEKTARINELDSVIPDLVDELCFFDPNADDYKNQILERANSNADLIKTRQNCKVAIKSAETEISALIAEVRVITTKMRRPITTLNNNKEKDYIAKHAIEIRSVIQNEKELKAGLRNDMNIQQKKTASELKIDELKARQKIIEDEIKTLKVDFKDVSDPREMKRLKKQIGDSERELKKIIVDLGVLEKSKIEQESELTKQFEQKLEQQRKVFEQQIEEMKKMMMSISTAQNTNTLANQIQNMSILSPTIAESSSSNSAILPSSSTSSTADIKQTSKTSNTGRPIGKAIDDSTYRQEFVEWCIKVKNLNGEPESATQHKKMLKEFRSTQSGIEAYKRYSLRKREGGSDNVMETPRSPATPLN